jgi:tetratricopeptide (TPR) repeat protein
MKKLLIIILIACNVSAFASNEQLIAGYESFKNNDRNNATVHFLEATNDPENKAEAFLMLSLIASVNNNDKAFDYLMEFYKSSSNPEPYLMALWNTDCFLASKSIKPKILISWMKDLLLRPNLNPTLKAEVMEYLAKNYESTNDPKTAKQYFEKIGTINEWQLTGEFENVSASGFDKDFGPLHHPGPDARFIKLGATVTWFPLYKQLSGKWVDLAFSFNCNSSINYAQTFCNSPVNQKVYLRVGTSGSLKVWVNDQLVFVESKERNNGLDTYVVPIELDKGFNRILLQVGSSDIDRCNFMARFTDMEGNPLIMQCSSEFNPYSKKTGALPIPVVLLPEAYFTKEIERNPDKLINYLLLAQAYLRNDKNHEALEVVSKAEVVAPNCSFLVGLKYIAYGRIKDKTMESQVMEKLKKVDPENLLVIYQKVNESFDKENYDEVLKQVELQEKIIGRDNSIACGNKFWVAIRKKNFDEASALIEKAYNQDPYDYILTSDKYWLEVNIRHNQNAANKILEKYLSKYFNKQFWVQLAKAYIENNKIDKGFAAENKLIDNTPSASVYYQYLARYYANAGKYNDAKFYYEEGIKAAPYYAHGEYADVLKALGDTLNAIKEYKKCLNFSPDDYDVRKKLNKLLHKTEAMDMFKQKDYDAIFKNSPNSEEYPFDPFLKLLEEYQAVLYDQGACETRIIQFNKVLTAKGIDNCKEFRMSYFSNEKLIVERAEVFKKNGNKLKAEVNNNLAVFTSLEVGDAVLLIYKKQKKVEGGITPYFYESNSLGTWYPSLKWEYNILASKNVNLNYKVLRSDLKPLVKDTAGFTFYSWQQPARTAIRTESYMPDMSDVTGSFQISTMPDWKTISNYYFDVSNTKTKASIEIKKKVAELLAGKDSIDEYLKARIIYDFIAANFRYSLVSFRQDAMIPQKAEFVFNTRIGDCKDLATLFVSMCRVAGIKADVVLVFRRGFAVSMLTLPSFHFDHAIAKATLNGKEYYIELTSPYCPFATAGWSIKKGFVLDATYDTTIHASPRLMNLSTRRPNNIVRFSEVSFPDEKVKVKVHTARTGEQAANVRAWYKDISKEERERKFTEAIANSFPNNKLVSLSFDKGLNNTSDSVTYWYTTLATNAFIKTSNLSIVKLPLTDAIESMNFLSNEDRQFPIDVWRYDQSDTTEEHQTITFPLNMKLAEMPKSAIFECKQASYLLQFDVKGNELLVHRRYICKDDVVPVEEYKTFRKFTEDVVKFDTQKLVFSINTK